MDLLCSTALVISMAGHERFCSNCGASFSAETKYCPECGNRVPGMDPKAVEADREVIRESVKVRTKWAGYIMLIYGIPLLCLGLYYFIDAQGIVDMLGENSAIVEQMNELGITKSEVEEYLIYFGSAWIIAGVAGIVSSVLCFKRTHYYFALSLCAISALFAASGLFMLLLGIMAFWMILTSKYGFKEYESKLEEELETIIR